MVPSEKERRRRSRLCPPPLLPPPRLPAARQLLCVSCDPRIMSVGTGLCGYPALPRPRALTKARAGLGGRNGGEKWLLLRLFAGRLEGWGGCSALLPAPRLHLGWEHTTVLPRPKAELAREDVAQHTVVTPVTSHRPCWCSPSHVVWDRPVTAGTCCK